MRRRGSVRRAISPSAPPTWVAQERPTPPSNHGAARPTEPASSSTRPQASNLPERDVPQPQRIALAARERDAVSLGAVHPFERVGTVGAPSARERALPNRLAHRLARGTLAVDIHEKGRVHVPLDEAG